MKKLFSLILLAFISTQMWGEDYVAYVGIRAGSGTVWIDRISNSTSGSATSISNSSASLSNINMHAIPAAGYVFEKWTAYNNDGTVKTENHSTWNPCTSCTLTKPSGSTKYPYTYKANFKSVTITVNKNIAAAGTASSTTLTPDKGTGYTLYATGSTTLTATENSGYKFKNWTLSSTSGTVLSTSTSYTYSGISNNVTIYANFEVDVEDVTVAVDYATGSNNTMGTIGGGTTVAAGTNVNLTASANSGYYFKGWSNSQDGSSILSNSNVASYAVSASNTTYYAVFAAPKEGSISPTGSNSSTSWVTPLNIEGAVDLGLPSGLLWKDRNIDATSTTNFGSYFAWGETAAMTGDAAPSASTYGFQGNDDMYTLTAAYDAASVNLGNGWRMPTKAEFQELIDYADWDFNYHWYVSGNNNTIVLPLGGQIFSQKYAQGTWDIGRYWTSDKISGSGNMKRPYYVALTNTAYSVTYDNSQYSTNCYAGYSIRPVHDGAAAKVLTIEVKVGDNVVATHTYRCDNGEKVKITADVPNGYNFVKWADNNSTATTREFMVTANATYNVIYEESVSYVTATFNNWNGSLLEEYTDVESGTTPTYSGSIPTKPADETYTYAFSGWSPELDDITENTTYTAQFTPTYINYSVTFRTSEDDANPAVKSDYHYGDEITNCPAIDPQKIGDETHTYTFLGWYLDNTETRYEAGMTVSGNMMFTARFNEQIIQVVPVTYNVTIGSFAANGKVIITSQDNVREITATGATLTFDAGKSVTIQAVPNAYYHFNGWVGDNDEEAVIDIRTLNDDLTYTPTFAANVALTLEDTHNEAYYSDLYSQHDGDVLTVTLANRQLTEGNWITFCAPFDFTIPAGHPFYGTAYQLQNATMSGTNTSAYISLDFRRTYEIRANVPYLIVPTMTTVSNLEFDGVTIEEDPTVRTTAAQSGQVEFVSVPWQTKITNDATKPNIYLASGNTLRYVSTATAGTTFRAFRAYFHRVVNLGAPRRMVISLDGVETTKQLTEDGEVTDTTEKRLENGVLIIERNGVRYDAQGKRL